MDEPNVLDRILGRDQQPEAPAEESTEAPVEPTPVVVEAGKCVNCANNGTDSTLDERVCPTCGYEAPVSN